MPDQLELQPDSLAGGYVCGDTKVALLDGHSLSIADLVEHLHRGVRHAIYAIQQDGSVHMTRLLGARRMSHDLEVVEVGLDDGSVVHCTPTQAFLGEDLGWVEARRLQPGEALLTVVHAHLWKSGRVDPDLHADTAAARRVVGVRKSPERAVYSFDVASAHNNLCLASGVFVHD